MPLRRSYKARRAPRRVVKRRAPRRMIRRSRPNASRSTVLKSPAILGSSCYATLPWANEPSVFTVPALSIQTTSYVGNGIVPQATVGSSLASGQQMLQGTQGLAYFYQRLSVLMSHIEITVTSMPPVVANTQTTCEVAFGAFPYIPGSTTPTILVTLPFNELKAQPGIQFKTLSAPYGSKAVVRFKGNRRTNRMLGVKDTTDNLFARSGLGIPPTFSISSTNPPTNPTVQGGLWFWWIGVYNYDPVDSVIVSIGARMRQRCKLVERRLWDSPITAV